MQRKPITDFILVKDTINKITKTTNIETTFKDLSESLAIVENDILLDEISNNFSNDLGTLIINYLTLLYLLYDIEDLYDFLISRSHWGIYNEEYFLDTKKSLVIPYYKTRIAVSSLILNTKNKKMPVKSIFDLAAYLIYLEEKN
jgi:hypothetical protein